MGSLPQAALTRPTAGYALAGFTLAYPVLYSVPTKTLLTPAAGCPDKPNCRVFSGRIHAIITREPAVPSLLRSKHLGRASGEAPQPVYNSPTPC